MRQFHPTELAEAKQLENRSIWESVSQASLEAELPTLTDPGTMNHLSLPISLPAKWSYYI